MKYGNIKVQDSSGHSFASKLEKALFDQLSFLERAGEIHSLKQQVNVHLTDARILYIADYSAIEAKSEQTVYYESKGFATAVWAIKKRLWKHYGPGRLEVWGGSYKNLIRLEVISPT